MKVRKITKADASFVISPGQDAQIFVGNVVDERHGGPVTIGYGRYEPNQSMEAEIAVDDTMIVLEGRIFVTSGHITLEAGPGEIIYMPRGSKVTIRSRGEGALTAYVTYPHWREAEAQ